MNNTSFKESLIVGTVTLTAKAVRTHCPKKESRRNPVILRTTLLLGQNPPRVAIEPVT